MSTTHAKNKISVPSLRPVRCFRHHVSMASCDDCGRVRTAQLASRRKDARAAS